MHAHALCPIHYTMAKHLSNTNAATVLVGVCQIQGATILKGILKEDATGVHGFCRNKVNDR